MSVAAVMAAGVMAAGATAAGATVAGAATTAAGATHGGFTDIHTMAILTWVMAMAATLSELENMLHRTRNLKDKNLK